MNTPEYFLLFVTGIENGPELQWDSPFEIMVHEFMVLEDICCFSRDSWHLKDKYPNPPLDSQDIVVVL